MKKPLLRVLILIMSILLVVLFSSNGCRRVEEPLVEEITVEPEEEALNELEAEEMAEEEYPTPVGYVNDFAHIFSQEHVDKIDKLIRDLEDRTTAEIAVVTINSLGEKSIEEYTFELFNSWGIGKKDKNNGILFLVAVKEHACRIEAGLGLEDIITNDTAQKILDEIAIPRFKEKEYGLGSYECVKRISEIIISSSN